MYPSTQMTTIAPIIQCFTDEHNSLLHNTPQDHSLILGHKQVLLGLSVDVVQEDHEEGVALSSGGDSPRGIGNRVLLPEGVLGEGHARVGPNVLHLHHSSAKRGREGERERGREGGGEE